MKRLFLVTHEIIWEGDNNWDTMTSNIVAFDAMEAIKKHEKFLSKYSFIDEDTKEKVGIKKFKLSEVRKIQDIDF